MTIRRGFRDEDHRNVARRRRSRYGYTLAGLRHPCRVEVRYADPEAVRTWPEWYAFDFPNAHFITDHTVPSDEIWIVADPRSTVWSPLLCAEHQIPAGSDRIVFAIETIGRYKFRWALEALSRGDSMDVAPDDLPDTRDGHFTWGEHMTATAIEFSPDEMSLVVLLVNAGCSHEMLGDALVALTTNGGHELYVQLQAKLKSAITMATIAASDRQVQDRGFRTDESRNDGGTYDIDSL